MKSQTAQTSGTKLNHDQIAARAYQIWEGAGHPAGSEITHWLQAEEELRAAENPKAGQPSPKPMQKAANQTAERAGSSRGAQDHAAAV
jgi:hypothetical protein